MVEITEHSPQRPDDQKALAAEDMPVAIAAKVMSGMAPPASEAMDKEEEVAAKETVIAVKGPVAVVGADAQQPVVNNDTGATDIPSDTGAAGTLPEAKDAAVSCPVEETIAPIVEITSHPVAEETAAHPVSDTEESMHRSTENTMEANEEAEHEHDADHEAEQEAGSASPIARRKRKSNSQEFSLVAPRLSPEPEDDPELAKRVREKNRLRMYRYHRNLEKRHSEQGVENAAADILALADPQSDSNSKPSAAVRPPKKAFKYSNPERPPSVGDNEETSEPPADVHEVEDHRAEEHEAFPESPHSAASAEGHPCSPKSTLKNRSAPRLSPVPEDAGADEQKRIKAKNRLRTYRWNKAQGIVKKRASVSGSEEHPDMGDDHPSADAGKNRTTREHSPADRSSASAFSSFHHMDSSAIAAMVAAAASAQQAASFPQDIYLQQQQMPSQPVMRGGYGAITNGTHSPPYQSPQKTKVRKAARAPSGPPRLSPEPEDPKEAKRVRSKNRVRMHRYNQSIAAAAKVDQEEPAAAAQAQRGDFVPSRQMPPSFSHQTFLQGYPGQFAPPSAYAAEYMQGDFRHAMDGQRGLPAMPLHVPHSQQSFVPPSISRPVPRNFGKRSASETGTDSSKLPTKKARRNTIAKAPEGLKPMDSTYSFFASLEEAPFQDLPNNLRELALETYIKETMGMASSLQSLEVQLRANQAVAGSDGGPIAQQSLALIAAVSQLRSDAWGLSQLRLSQYASMNNHSNGNAPKDSDYRAPIRPTPKPAVNPKADNAAAAN